MDEKRIKHTVDLTKGTVAYSLGEVKHSMSLVKDFGVKASGLALMLAASAIYRLLVDACSGGDITATHDRMIDSANQIKSGCPIPLLPWGERKLVLAMQAFMKELGNSEATVQNAFDTIVKAGTVAGKAKTIDGKETAQTAWDNIQAENSFRALIPKKEAAAPKAPNKDLLASIGL